MRQSLRQTSGIAVAISAFLALCAAPAYGQTPRGFTAEDMVSLHRVSEPNASPDGRYLAYVVRETDLAANRGRTDLFVQDLSARGATAQRLAADPAGDSQPRWNADSTRIFFLSSRSGSAQVWSIEPNGAGLQQVTNGEVDLGGFALSPKGDRVIVWADVFPDCADFACTRDRLAAKPQTSARGYDRIFVRHWDTWKDGTRSQIFAYALGTDGKASGSAVRISRGLDGDTPHKPFGDASDVAVAPDGNTLYFVLREAGALEPTSTNLDIFAAPLSGDGPITNLTAANAAGDTNPVIAPNGRQLAYLAMRRPGFEADRQVLMLRDLASGQTRALTDSFDRSIGSFSFTADGTAIIASVQDTGTTRLYRIDAQTGAVTPLTTGGSVGEFTLAGDNVIFTHHTLTRPADLYRASAKVASTSARWTRLSDLNADRLKGINMGSAEQFSFAGANGEKVHGYVVKPANFRRGRKYPVAFLIHGGPQGSFGDQWHYRWNAQTYTGAGYGVVMIDFHGSTGYGQAFTDSISGDWGGKPLEDLQKGWAHALEAYPWLDGSRACALGGSYGGWMVSWIAGQWADGFDCLVNHAGILDNRSMNMSTEEMWFTEWEFGGTAWENPAGWAKHNPVDHVGAWKTPMLVLHGEKDFRVPYLQGIAMFQTLQRRGIPSRLVMFPDENHWILKPANSVRWHEEVLSFMGQHTAE